MKVVVTASGTHLDAPISPIFGRCRIYLFVDTETLAYEAVENPASSASAGAGIQAAQFVVEHGARALLTGNIGPNAANALQAADVPVYQIFEGTVQHAVDMFRQGRLNTIGGANVPSHSGMRGGRGMGMGRGRGRGAYGQGNSPSAPAPPPEAPASGRDEIAVLRQTADELRRQLNKVTERLEKLEED
jgi:predicted Fe-Mo cluster-binding NifX family protein